MSRLSQPRKIMLLVRLLGQGGSERQTVVTALELRKRGYETHIGCVDPKGIRAQELRAAGVPILSLPIRTLAAVETVRQGLRLRDYIRQKRIDLVHSFDVPMNIFGVPFAVLARRAVVLSSQRAHRELTPGLHHYLLRATDRMVDGIVVNCDFMRRHLVEDERIRPERIRLCYNGIDLAQFRPAEGGGRDRVPEFGDARLVIGVVCALRKEKGLSTLVEAFARVHSIRTGVKLAIVGSGVCLEELQQQAASLGVTGDMVFVPETRDVARFLRGMDIFVLPSLSEALSNSLMEAMAAGCCALASRVGGNPELIHDGTTGLLFDKADAAGLAGCLEKVLTDDALRQRLSDAGQRRTAAAFTLEASAQTMALIYEEFLGARR